MRQLTRRQMIAATTGLAGGALLNTTAPVRAATTATQAADDGWTTLFDGKSLEGWHTNPEKIWHGTGGRWFVEPDGVLAGEHDPPGSGNGGLLLTDRAFGDFELSLDIKPDWGVDSGVLLRTTDRGQAIQVMVDYYNGGNIGHFYGEQVGAWAARAFSIQGHEENGRLARLTTFQHRTTTEASLVSSCRPDEWLDAWKIDEFNHLSIRVEGGRYPRVTTTLNRLKVGVFDAATATAGKYDREHVARLLGEEGSVAVQVHGGTERFPAGRRCRWRNIRIRNL